ncbi:hypothetical protein ACIOG8_31575 [Streptomyces erythrochromogenes]|uniref:hypothetical protein n=1 Tax=Streptomyces erythrochromogenes TaxID=285574 RepID=UPI0037FD66BB
MRSARHDADAYGQELARISHHQHEAMSVRFTVFQAAAVGIGHEQADDIVAKLEARAVAGAHTWISESSPPHGSEPQCEDGWFAGDRNAASYLLRIADTTVPGGAHRLQRHAPCGARGAAPSSGLGCFRGYRVRVKWSVSSRVKRAGSGRSPPSASSALP